MTILTANEVTVNYDDEKVVNRRRRPTGPLNPEALEAAFMPMMNETGEGPGKDVARWGGDRGEESGSGTVSSASSGLLEDSEKGGLEEDVNPKTNADGACARVRVVLVHGVGKALVLLALLYFFICSLDLLSSAFRLLGGRMAGAAFTDSTLLRNPVVGLMTGILATVLVQSSSTSTSIVVTMVASGVLKVEPAIPIIMGANIGTSVTNTIVSLAQSSNVNEFKLAFAGATVHDMFNWLTVGVLLPVEALTGYLFHLTSAMVDSFNLSPNTTSYPGAGNSDMLKTITKPLTELIVQLDKNVIEGIAMNDQECVDKPLMKTWCEFVVTERDINVTESSNVTDGVEGGTWKWDNRTNLLQMNVTVPVKQCSFLFNTFGLGDAASGAILLILSLVVLCSCLVLMVKLLNSALHGRVMTVIKRVVNADLPVPGGKSLTGYAAMLVGAALTIVVQSSSVFTSTLTPLVGIGVVTLERMYPLTLGSNIGTTTTGLIAAMTASRDQLRAALQIALVHLCFNVSGILMFYPIPATRVPIRLARMMGNTTAKYRWFAVFYVLVMFFLLPLAIFSLSLVSPYLMLAVVLLVLFVLLLVILLNCLQRRRRAFLPPVLRTWEFLPHWMRSLAPLNDVIMAVVGLFGRVCKRCAKGADKGLALECADKGLALEGADKGAADASSDSVAESKELGYNSKHGGSDVPSVVVERDSITEALMPRNASAVSFIDMTPTVVLYRDCDSGFASMTNTPCNTPWATPCMSRLQSCAAIPQEVIQEEEDVVVETSDNANHHLSRPQSPTTAGEETVKDCEVR